MDGFNASDLTIFDRLRITKDILARAGVQRLTDEEARRLLGASHPGNLAGLFFPYLDPVSGQRVSGRLRRDHSEIGADGKPEQKYLCSYGDNRHLYFPPGSGSLLSDPSVPAAFVESEKAGLAITALTERMGETVLVIGTGGCWGWRGKAGIGLTSNGTREEIRGPLPDFDRVKWTGRRVRIVFDSNVRTNPGVAAARENLAREVAGRGAKVYFVDVPEAPAINGPDDFIAVHGDDAFVTLLKSARPFQFAKGKPRSTNGFQLTKLGDLMREEEETCPWLVDGILPAGGIGLLAAKPKTGKSTLARCLALSVARGQPFLNRATLKGAVIYLALEEKRSEVRSHFRAMGATGEERIFIHAAHAPADALALIGVELKRHNPVLLIIDPVLRFVRVKDANDYAQVSNALEPILTLARENGVHVLLVYHLGKGERAEATDAILGSTAFFAAVDTALIMKRYAQYRTVQTRQRYGDDMVEVTLQFNGERRTLSLGAERSEVESAAVGDQILHVVQEARELMTEPEITDAVGGKTTFVRRALRELVKQGEVVREGAGKRGDPYRYRFSFSCSPHRTGTREQESEKQGRTSTNTEPNLVPGSEQKPFVVPADCDGQKTVNPVPEKGQDTMEI